MNPGLDDLRRYAIARSLFAPTTLDGAITRLGFVQADPIRAPARAQDLTLRHRVHGYRAGDLERQYPTLDLEEDFFVNYGFLPRGIHGLMHPRHSGKGGTRRQRKLLDYIRERGEGHPREVDRHFAHGTVTNYWGGTSSATTHLLDKLHYLGRLRIARRDGGIRVYAIREDGSAAVDAAGRLARIDALIDVVVGKYAPLPGPSLSWLVQRLRYAVPQWQRSLADALKRTRARLSHQRIDGVEWYWPAGESATGHDVPAGVRLLTPFDPVVWDRRRFELFWNWKYRFEAYTPVKKRKFGYYALPLLWQDRVAGWANLSIVDGALDSSVGYVDKKVARARGFRTALDEELDRMRVFLAPRSGGVRLQPDC